MDVVDDKAAEHEEEIDTERASFCPSPVLLRRERIARLPCVMRHDGKRCYGAPKFQTGKLCLLALIR